MGGCKQMIKAERVEMSLEFANAFKFEILGWCNKDLRTVWVFKFWEEPHGK